jgi:hypothetical protein
MILEMKATQAGVQTKAVAGRRRLHFGTVGAAVAEVDRLADAERAGRLRHVGNWRFGQILGHLAGWVDYSYDGVPMKVPAVLRWVARPFKNRMLYKPMGAGSWLPRVPNGTFCTEAMDTEQGLARFRSTFGRLGAECPARPHALLGPLTHQEWINQHLRHAELHLSFLHDDPDDPAPTAAG